MFITDEKAKQRLNSPDNLASPLELLGIRVQTVNGPEKLDYSHQHTKHQLEPTITKPINNGGRRPGDNNVPSFIREIAGTQAHFEKSKDVASAYGISKSAVDQYKIGNTSANTPDPKLKSAIENRLEAVQDLAMKKLMMSLNLIDEDKTKKLSAKDISIVSSNMSRVVERTLPKQQLGDQLQIIFYSPTIRKEDSYETITINAEPDS